MTGDIGEPPAPAVARGLAAAGGLAVAAGAAAMLTALVAAPGPWTTGYVSEAGIAGLPFAAAYRIGLVLLGLGVALIGAGLTAAVRLAGVLLVAAAVLAATSGVVPCSAGCPLPPFEPTTTANVVHTVASIVGMFLLAVTMLVIALFSTLPTAQRRLAGVAASIIVPLGLWLFWIMLFVGRGQLGATLERWELIVAVSWLIGTATVAGLAQPDQNRAARPERALGPSPQGGPEPSRTDDQNRTDQNRTDQNRTVANDPAEANPQRA